MIKKFLSYYKPHRKLFAIDMFCAFLMAVCGLVYPRIAQNIINVYAPAGDIKVLVVASCIMLAIFILRAVLNYVVTYWGHIMGVRIQADMRRDFFYHLQRMPFSYFDENKTGTIMSRIINDLFEIAELSHHGPEDLFLSLITLIGALVMVGLINVYLTLMIIVVVPFMLWFAIIQRKRMKSTFASMRQETGEINASVESAISGIRVSRAYTATEHELEKFDKSNSSFVEARSKAYKAMAIFGTGMGFFADMLYLIPLAGGGIFLALNFIDVGEFTGFILYSAMVIAPIRTLTAIFEQIQGGMTGFARFVEVIEQDTEAEISDALALKDLKGEIEFKNVCFNYSGDDAEDLVLDNVSFKVKAGETIALVGPSGGGKTTMCHLIPRFYELSSGSISIDGYDITTLTRLSLRKNIGIVAQDVFLFGGTIKENIAYGNLDASDEEIFEASKKANIHDYIMTLPHGYETQVGERGVKLSGGQKQRVSIARAFLKNPPVLILDEATSALDNVTEMLIQQALDELQIGRTTIVVAHRLSTIKNADEIMVVTKDGIAERGTHENLIETKGIYAELYNHQFKDIKD